MAGRYNCAKGKKVGIAKAGKVCLIKRCPFLQVKYKNKYQNIEALAVNAQGC